MMRSLVQLVLVVTVVLEWATCAHAMAASYTYDALSRLVQVQLADGSTLLYAYDPAGNRVGETVDTAEPSVSIAVPTVASEYATSTGVVDLGGSATDDVGITEVAWSNDRGGSGTATGTTAWSVPGIPLQLDANVITITAHDAVGKVGSATLTVTFELPTPTDTPTAIPTDTPLPTITPTDAPTAIPTDTPAPTPTMTDTPPPTMTPSPTATPLPCHLDVDGSGRPAKVSTDVVYIARRLLGFAPVPPSFRTADPTIPSDATIAANIDAAKPRFDVDQRGGTQVSTDIVYIARRLLGFAPVPPSFRAADPTIPSDAEIAARIDALCP